jgi:hypothetical protein
MPSSAELRLAIAGWIGTVWIRAPCALRIPYLYEV